MSLSRDVSVGNTKPTRVRVSDWEPITIYHTGEHRLVCFATLGALQWELWDDTDCLAQWSVSWEAFQQWKFKSGGTVAAFKEG